MKNLSAILVRVFIVGGLLVGGFVAYKVYASKSSTPVGVAVIDKVKGVSTTALGPVVNGFIDQASRKLTDSQPIIQNASGAVLHPEVKGDSTSNQLSDQIRGVAQNAANQIMDQIKDIPKKEAARVTRQMCDQLVSELEK